MAIAWHNGFWVDDTSQVFNLNHRITRYGDGFFETILAIHSQPLWLNYHYERFEKTAKLLGLIIPSDFSFYAFKDTLRQLCEKSNEPFQRIRLVVYRNGSGAYLPTSNYAGIFVTSHSTSFHLECQLLNRVGIYDAIQKPMNMLSALKSSNALLFVLAAHFAKEKQLDDVILLNTENRICEATSSNIFVIKGDVIFTPPLSEGCVDGVLRRLLISHFAIKESDITHEFLISADGLFLTNTIQGVCAVNSIGDKTYSIEAVRVIHSKYIELISSAIDKPF